MAESLGVGLIGTGFMGKCHAMAWTSVRGVFGDVARPRLEVVCDSDPGRADQTAESFGFERTATDWRTLVADDAVEVVSIAAPNQFHAEIAVAALRAGKHVWCEKPMAVTLAEAEAMRREAAQSPGKTLLGYNYVQNPAVGQAVRLLQEGTIGKIANFRAVMDEDFMADGDSPWSLKSGASSGYGVLDDFGCHTVSLAHLLAGPIAAVAATATKPFATRPAPDGGAPRAVETDDVANVALAFASGASGAICLNRSAWGHKGRLDWEIQGSRGTIAFSQERMNELRLYLAEDDARDGAATNGFRTIFTGPQHPPYGLFCPAPGHGLGFNELKVIEAAHFLRVIAGREAPTYDFERAFEIERVVHAMARSARDGRWVEVADVKP